MRPPHRTAPEGGAAATGGLSHPYRGIPRPAPDISRYGALPRTASATTVSRDQARDADDSRSMGSRSGNSCGRERRKALPPSRATASTARMRTSARPGSSVRAPQAQEKGQTFGRTAPQQRVLGRCQSQGAGTAQSTGFAQQQAFFRMPGRMQHAHRGLRRPAPKKEVRRAGKIIQTGREIPPHRDRLPCRGQGPEHQHGIFRLRHVSVTVHAPAPAGFRTISCPMTKA